MVARQDKIVEALCSKKNPHCVQYEVTSPPWWGRNMEGVWLYNRTNEVELQICVMPDSVINICASWDTGFLRQAFLTEADTEKDSLIWAVRCIENIHELAASIHFAGLGRGEMHSMSIDQLEYKYRTT